LRVADYVSRQIHRAAQNPVNLDYNAVSSVEVRIMLDLRIGSSFTRMQSLKLQAEIGREHGVISYGIISLLGLYKQIG
jgi:DNA topoisomerase III